MFTGASNGIEVDVAFQYNDQYSESILSFVNNVRTKQDGTHKVVDLNCNDTCVQRLRKKNQ